MSLQDPAALAKLLDDQFARLTQILDAPNITIEAVDAEMHESQRLLDQLRACADPRDEFAARLFDHLEAIYSEAAKEFADTVAYVELKTEEHQIARTKLAAVQRPSGSEKLAEKLAAADEHLHSQQRAHLPPGAEVALEALRRTELINADLVRQQADIERLAAQNEAFRENALKSDADQISQDEARRRAADLNSQSTKLARRMRQRDRRLRQRVAAAKKFVATKRGVIRAPTRSTTNRRGRVRQRRGHRQTRAPSSDGGSSDPEPPSPPVAAVVAFSPADASGDLFVVSSNSRGVA